MRLRHGYLLVSRPLVQAVAGAICRTLSRAPASVRKPRTSRARGLNRPNQLSHRDGYGPGQLDHACRALGVPTVSDPPSRPPAGRSGPSPPRQAQQETYGPDGTCVSKSIRRRCRTTKKEPPHMRGLCSLGSHPWLPGWVTGNHEETHYFPPVITSHPSWESGRGWASGYPGRPTR